MKVLDLACSHGHDFEGWFGSEDDFQNQLARDLVQCPICDDVKIIKRLSAPRLNLRGDRKAAPSVSNEVVLHPASDTNLIANNEDSTRTKGDKGQNFDATADEVSHPLDALMRNPEFQSAYMQMAREVLAKTEDVGGDFAREARKIHYGESPQRGIRGQTTRDEALELLDEGIEVMSLPLPKALKGPLQ